MLYEITHAVAHPNHTVTITWSDGIQGEVNFTPFITKGVFAALQDPAYFVREMRLLRSRIGLEWPNEVDFSADGLRYDAFPQEALGEFEEPVSVSKAVSMEAMPAHHDRPC